MNLEDRWMQDKRMFEDGLDADVRMDGWMDMNARIDGGTECGRMADVNGRMDGRRERTIGWME
uniref:Uncharacterized protein n=1 Tax=Setaria digitata TaxID=48799 RepID=A0A915Q3B8_9BILA